MERLSRAQLKMIKKLPMAELERFLMEYGQNCFQQGVEEGQKCFDDPEMYQIVDADVVRERLGDDLFNELVRGE